MNDGSREVKDVLLNECSVLFDCKVCRSLFRSLANLLAHKRVYCTQHLCEAMPLCTLWVPSEEPTPPRHRRVAADAHCRHCECRVPAGAPRGRAAATGQGAVLEPGDLVADPLPLCAQ
ncbi:hypothetical protein HPB49_006678 [Dermacentor silvarum]|uniref:Uncharacterized protein n=1 Tax=Dermacentor silvarum TaxID=543639 RepID=A0ACB8DWV2_DERSI|nr:hypothetical protein HPB49_006678 [Dermacentor silvarum]